MKLALGLIASLLVGSIGSAALRAPTDLNSKPISNRLGLHLNEYSFSWSAPEVVSWHLLVASTEAKLAAEVGDLWDSGVRTAPVDEVGVRYLGSPLQDGVSVYWKVRGIAKSGEVGSWSEAQKLEVPSSVESDKQVHRPGGSDGKLEFVKGRMGKAVHLGKERATVWSDDYEGLRSTEGTTILTWIKPSQVGDAWQCIYRKEDGEQRRLLAIGAADGVWGLWCGFNIGGHYVEFGVPVDREKMKDGNWHHVAVTFDQKKICLYLDGKRIGQTEKAGKLGGNGKGRAYIGSHAGKERFEGAIDEVEVYGSALSDKQIADLVSGNLEGSFPIPAGHWKFESNVRNEVTIMKETLRNRIVFLGGTMISRMDKHGYLENAITVNWPQHDITFRNLAWPADDVFGTARSEFGSAHNTRSWQPPKGEVGFGFETLKGQLAQALPSTLIVGYGGEAAFADTVAKQGRFEAGYRALIDELEKTGATLVLLTPILNASHEKILPEVEERNERLKKAARFILALAEAREHYGIDLIADSPFGDDPGQFYENGVHLNERGYRRLAFHIGAQLGVEALKGEGVAKGFGGPGRSENLERTRLGLRYDFTLNELPSLVDEPASTSEGKKLRIWIDGEEVLIDANGWIRSGADYLQSEKLRETVIEKNKLHRYKLNPINKAYIFLFRRHEMGHLAYELEDFDELVEGREQAIAKLRVPRTHRYEIEEIREWKSPRNYPDHEVPSDIPVPDVAAELKAFTVAEGFKVNLWAKNPAIFNPINMNWDRHNRAWVSTSSTYPHIKPGRIPNDRIVILEDTDRDGVADKHTVFAEGLTVPHSVIPVEGGAYVCSTTEVLFLADHDGDDRMDEKRVVFSGFGNADVHHMIHGLRWSPWGDLFFTQSIYINSFVETAHGPRRLNGSGVWRFRPEIERIDVFSRGRVNPWGHALNRFGNSFGTDGAGGQGPYDLFPGSAFGTAVGAPRVLRGLVPGKPKNTGAEFMTGRHLPSGWHGSMLGNDFRANRTVRYSIEENGSGFKSQEVETVLHSSHRSYRPVDIKLGPDGAIYVVDWYNPIIDHGEVDFHHPSRDKSHGRIWRVTAVDQPLVEWPKIADASVEELLEHLTAEEQYSRAQANRELVRRKVSRESIDAWIERLDSKAPSYDHHLLEALWLAIARNEKTNGLEGRPLRSADPRIRAAAVRAVGRTAAGMPHLAVAVEDDHPRVRLEAVSALRGLGTKEAADLALRALSRDVDQNLDFALEMTVRDTRDAWLPAMQAGAKVFEGDADRLSYALNKVNDPRAIEALAEVIAKGELQGEALGNAVTTVASLGSPEQVGALLQKAQDHPEWLPALARGVTYNRKPPQLKSRAMMFLASESAPIRTAAATLCGAWKISDAEALLVKAANQAKNPQEALAMTTALAEIGATVALSNLSLAEKPAAVRAAAIAAAAKRDPTKQAAAAAGVLADLKKAELAPMIIEAYLSRDEGPAVLAQALAESVLAESVALAASRSASASGRDVPELLAALNKAGGLKTVAQSLSAEERRQLIEDVRGKGSAEAGRVIYQRTAMACTACHLVNGKGGKLGPDLSTVGSYMTAESILESLLNPSTDIKQGYETVLVTRKDKTLVSGLLQRKTDVAVLVRDPAGQVISIPTGEVAKIDTSPVSLMPPGLTASLRRDELVDLMSYLTTLGASKRTVPGE